MLNRQSAITTTAYYNCTEWKNQLKIANYVTIGKKNSCPLNGKCLTKCVVYKATLTETTSNNQVTYIGLTENEFKTRFNLHKPSFKLEHKRTSTTLSEHVWKLKNKNMNFNITWDIVKKVKPFAPNDKVCKLCLQEKTIHP